MKEFQDNNKFTLRMSYSVLYKYNSRRACEKNRADSVYETSN